MENAARIAAKYGGLFARRTVRHLKENPRSRSMLQAAITVLVILWLVLLVKSMMTDEEADSSFRTTSDELRFSELFADDEVTDEHDLDLLVSPGRGSGESKLRADLFEFLQKNNPAKIPNIDAIIGKYPSRSAVNEALMKKYGQDLESFRHTARRAENVKPNPSTTEAKSSASSSSQSLPVVGTTQPQNNYKPALSTEARLQKFFALHNPEKVSSVNQLVKKYSLTQLNNKLRKKYGSDLTDDISQVDTDDEIKAGFDVMERKTTAFFQKHRPGESAGWIKRFVQQYMGQIDHHLRNNYGYSLEGAKVEVDTTYLEARLTKFFREHNSEKIATVSEAAKRYARDVGKLNGVLREKYGVDLNGKQSKGPTSEKALLRVKFTRPRQSDPGVMSGKSNRYLEELFSSIETLPIRDESFSSSDYDSIGDDSGWHEEDFEQVVTPKLKLICIGLPFTGCNKVAQFSDAVLGLDVMPADDLLTVLMRAVPGPASLPNMDILGRNGALVAESASYFMQELLVTFPHARIIIAVRDVHDWWRDVSSKSQEDWWGCPAAVQQRCECVFNDVFFGDCAKSRHMQQYLLAYEAFFERALQLIPHSRRILIDANGGINARRAFGRLAREFRKESDSWIAKNTPSVDANRLANLSRLHRYSIAIDPESDIGGEDKPQSLKTKEKAKMIVLGLDSTGADAVSSALGQIGLSKGPLITKEWIQLFNQKLRDCEDCVAMQRYLADDKPLKLTWSKDVLGGGLANWIAPILINATPGSRVVLTIRSMRQWTKEIRCYLAAFEGSEKESLLSSKRVTAVPSIIRSLWANLYGLSSKRLVGGVSDYHLMRRYQDFVDYIALYVPPERLLILNVFDKSDWGDFCQHASAPRSCASKLRNLGANRILVSAC